MCMYVCMSVYNWLLSFRQELLLLCGRGCSSHVLPSDEQLATLKTEFIHQQQKLGEFDELRNEINGLEGT